MPTLNALNPVTDINSIVQFVNAQATGGAPIAPEVFYSKQLLDTIRYDQDQFVYYRLADTAPIQEKADKLMLRRWSALRGHTVPLAEGVPPKSDKGSVEKYELEAFSYGRYMEFTDKVDFKAVDPVVAHYSKEYSIVAIETLDLLARDTLLMVSQKYYAGGGSSTDDFTFTNGSPKMIDLMKIVLAFKKTLVKPRANGKFHVIASPEFYFDMLSDPLVEKYMTINQTTKTMYDGGLAPIVPMFGLEFYETLVVPTSGEYVDENGNKRLKVWQGVWGGEEVTDVIGTSDAQAPALADLIETDATQYAVVDGYELDARTGQPGSYIPGKETWTLPANTKEFKMQHVFVVGAECLTRTGLAGQDNAKMYVKPLGSSGVIDPIDQRQSIGFKINSIGFGSTRPEAVYDYVCVPSLVNF
jgi:N4-gp56 family major capsid protein